jgi:hypothetical protein
LHTRSRRVGRRGAVQAIHGANSMCGDRVGRPLCPLAAQPSTFPPGDPGKIAAVIFRARAIVDNAFATPNLQSPPESGAELVTHRATEYPDGRSDIVLGAVVGKDEDYGRMESCSRNLGSTPALLVAVLLIRKSTTPAVGVRAQSRTTGCLAMWRVGKPGECDISNPGRTGKFVFAGLSREEPEALLAALDGAFWAEGVCP